MKLQKLINKIENIDGISKKLSQKIALNLIKDDELIINLKEIIKSSQDLSMCEVCGLIKDKDTECNNCLKDYKKLFIFENHLNFISISNKTKIIENKFILGIETKKDLTNYEKIKTYIERLDSFLNNKEITEIIFILSPSLEAEIIIKVLKDSLKAKSGLTFTKILTGVPFGGSVEYTDEVTLRKAIEKREEIK